MASNIRIGIIGSGGIAGAHARAYKQMKDVEIIAVQDVVPGKADEFISKWELDGAVGYQDHLDLLKLDLDGVSVCTPNVAHHRTSIDALMAGKNVLVEKPLAVTLQQGIEMVQAAKKSEKILTVGFQPRYDPNMKAIKEIVELHYTTGGYSIFAKIVCHDTNHLREVLNEHIQGVKGIQRTETFISLEESIRRQITLE